ncbi:conserved oligomeric Golgi complex subunit 4 [Kluyveromyces marxianus]|uniref:Conserved oligomeric Golgi complex subunit 4 n=2 Tax=Kluyveromyces marxianus TaxID=4911 RepID=W0T5Y6_KLUMD|nr:conserved oligomeric Golgi complex subunit 4 [Kluyveromyces marxianus DMKU3-1042]QGN14537.1 conserved oligomeric Golgi complex subunit 4 [Kluyveromyces marxianus]BAO38800.1 conserved oligomeric Golgi complex subunit 4 [Kluyveromyces marxianus DMKU3-1042]
MDLDELHLDSKLSKFENLIGKLSTKSQLPKLLHLIESDYNQTNLALNNYIKTSNSNINRSVRSLELEKTNLTSTLSVFHEALESLSNSNVQATSISTRLNAIKTEYAHINQLADFVDSVKLLKNNLQIINDVLNSKEHNYPMIAQCIYEIDQLPESLLNSKFVQRCVPTSELPDPPAQLVKKWKSQLSEVFTERFTRASQEQDVNTLTECFKLFPKIGASDLGIDLYSKYICDIIAQQSRSLMTHTSDDPLFYSKSTLHLFKIVSTMINDHSKIILQNYSTAYMLETMQKVQLETDLQACLIWDTFFDSVSLPKIRSSLSDYTDMKRLQAIVLQISNFLQNWSMYCQFFSMKWLEWSKEPVNPLQIVPCLTNGKFNSKLQENIDTFHSMALHYTTYCFKSSLKTSQLGNLNESLHEEQSRTSNGDEQQVISPVLEDLAILVKSYLVWTLNTGQTALVTKSLDSISQMIQNEYLISFLQSRLTKLIPRLIPSLRLQKYISDTENAAQNQHHTNSIGVTAAQKKFTSQFAAFNLKETDMESVLNLHHYIIYVNTISTNESIFTDLLENEIIKINPHFLIDNFKFNNEHEIVKSKLLSVLKYLLDNNKKLWNWSLMMLYQNVLQENLQRLISVLFQKNTEFVSTLQDFEDFEKLHTFVQEWNKIIIPYKQVLSAASFNELLTAIVKDLCPMIETKFRSLQFNELGSIKIEKQLSVIIKTICMDNYQLRERFKKLTQMCLLLGFEDDQFDPTTEDLKEDVLNSLNWLLTVSERISVRQQRIDKR